MAAIARVKRPGVKFDNIPVLNGNQGIGKSTLIAKLGRERYSDSLSISDMKDKTAPEKLQGNWLLELSEMAGIKKMDVETVKSFASRIDDKYRPSYGRVVESHPRQTVVLHHIIAKGTIDERVLKALSEKDRTQTALIDAVKAAL